MSIPSAIAAFKHKTWKPVIAPHDGPPSASKFSGTPWLQASEEWPPCQNCGKPMQLFIQLNLDELPEALKGEIGQGLLQLFYCTSQEPLCEIDCRAFFPFAKSVLIRISQPIGEAHTPTIPEIHNLFPSKHIVGWEERDDYPNEQEGAQLGMELEESEWESLNNDGFPRSGDKLSGWPNWIQGVEYPKCPLCDEQMRLVFQIDSKDNLPVQFGDFGCGHLTQCRRHQDQLAFGWACF